MLYMAPVQGKVLQMALSYQPVTPQGEAPAVEDWYTDTRNVEYTLYNNTKGVALTDYSMQQGNIVLPTGADTGDHISVTARSLNRRFVDATAEAIIADNDTALVSLRLVAYDSLFAFYLVKRTTNSCFTPLACACSFFCSPLHNRTVLGTAKANGSAKT